MENTMKYAVLLLTATLMASSANAQQGADVPRAKNLFALKCAACHSVACNRQGPKLEGLIGRQAGSVADFKNYTVELKASGIVWSEKTLDEYINDPGKVVPGTSMSATGRIESAADRRDIIAHVRRQDRSSDLCI
jgi:cytochrome c